MSEWYVSVTEGAAQDDWQPLLDCIEYFEKELQEAREEVKIQGNIERVSGRLPGIVEHRFRQYQEIEHILEYLNIKYNKLKNKHFRKYLEHYNRQLSSRDAEKFAEGEEEVVDMNLLVNRFALLRNQYQAIQSALNAKQFQLNNITRLRAAGLEDAELYYNPPRTK
jgi:hypothetical protein